MKTIISTFAVLTFFGSVATAEPFSSPAYIQQVSSTAATVRLSTSELVAPIISLASQMPSLRPNGPGNLGLIWQDGINNNANIEQTGSRNVGLIRQIGLDNVASISQSGIGHQALVFQQGRGNVAIIRQR
ncbi:hypothetical protein [Mesorhizobium sp. CAU 1732]|uniref:hypothetical protein n=1 Tax=Mesorhizobium sp. CAU 1732 TaxID=3140358 RepID=UPI00325FEFBA